MDIGSVEAPDYAAIDDAAALATDLAALDLRQNADVHEAVVAELLAAVGVASDYLALEEAARVASGVVESAEESAARASAESSTR